jgi:hypothetical protein
MWFVQYNETVFYIKNDMLGQRTFMRAAKSFPELSNPGLFKPQPSRIAAGGIFIRYFPALTEKRT